MLTPAAFLAALEECLGRAIRGNERLGLAVSGGADSLGLLLLAVEALPGRVVAITVDHGLRAGSAQEAEAVAKVCEDLGTAHRTLTLSGLAGANLQARAREARYAAMAEYCLENGLRLLATAHHADDQAETLLMRLARGTGTTGAGGIRACRRLGAGLLLIRPLLGWRKRLLVDHVQAAGLVPADDPTNRDDRFDRTRARRLLAENKWLDAEGLAVSARHLARESEALEWVAQLAWEGRADGRGVDVEGLPPALRYRLVVRALAESGCSGPRGPAVERLIKAVSAGKSATLGGVRVRPGRRWRFSRAPSHRTLRSG